MEIRINADLSAAQKTMAKFPDARRRATISRITEALLLFESEIKKVTPVGAGPVHLRDTIFHKVQIGEPIWGMVATPAKYGEALELGARPHFPPIAPIQHWVQRVLGITGEGESKSVAYLVARAISRRGTKGREMFGKTFRERRAQAIGILEKIPADIVKAVIA